MENKKGISLITLIIIIVVIVILAGAVIINLVNTNIIGNANKAVDASKKGAATDEINLVTYDLFVEENKEDMTQETKRTYLENKLKEYDSSSVVEISDTGFIANHRGYVFEISDKYEISIKETVGTDEEVFNAEEWDKTATSEDLFEWDNTGTIIVGYKEGLANNEKIRIPSKCVAIIPNELWQSSTNRSKTTGGIKKIELPSTITKIGNCAFAEFKDLEEINIPKRVTSIGSYAFGYCSSLTNIEIPDSVTYIEAQAFQDCTGITSLIIPESVTNIGIYAFGSWNSSQTIYCEVTSKPSGWNESWHSYSTGVNIVWGYKILSEFDAEEWDKTATSEDLFIWDEAGTSIIGYSEQLAGHEKIRVPSKCVSISANSVWVSASSRSVISAGVKKIELPETITEIGDYAFTDFKDLEEINIPERVNNVGEGAFNNCTKIASIIIPEGVTTTGYSVFSNWTSDQTIYCEVTSQPSGWKTGYENANVVWGYKMLSGFNAAEWDKTATPDDYFEWDETGTIITGYKESIANNLTKIRIPSKCVAIIPDTIWQSNSNTRAAVVQGVKKVEIPETVTTIGDYAFVEFKDLEEINISNRVTSIGSHAFSYCSSLTSVTIPDSVTNIGNYAFDYCTGVTSIVIPNSVTSIGYAAFADWTSNQTIYCRASSQPSGWNSLWNGYYGTTVNVVWGYTGE